MIKRIISEKKPEVTHQVPQSAVRALHYLYLALERSQTADNCQFRHSSHEQINETQKTKPTLFKPGGAAADSNTGVTTRTAKSGRQPKIG